MIDVLQRPWPWFVSGPLLGAMVPLLLLLGNQHFGVSSSLQHICAAALPLKAAYFRYDWKAKAWSLFMMAGIVVGALLAVVFLEGDRMPEVSDGALALFRRWGLSDFSRLQPPELFATARALVFPNVVILTAGGFLVGFGTRYANGCTSGHAIMGLSLLNGGSLVATVSFLAGGIAVSHVLVPFLAALGAGS